MFNASKSIYRKNELFAEVLKNLARYKSKRNFIEQNNYRAQTSC